MGALSRKNILTFWLLVLLFFAGEILLQTRPYIHFYPKSDYVLGEYKLSSFRTEYVARHSTKYSVFVDDSNNIVKVCSSLNDYQGRKVRLYVRSEDDAFREKFELKYIGIIEIIVILWLILVSGITVAWLKALKQQ